MNEIGNRKDFFKPIQLNFGRMPLFGKKDSGKKPRKDGRDSEKLPSIEDKYNMKELLGT